ncbi:hypothetical protein VTH06DRAFT_8644 [Thermothelomyces fergusii]
MLIYVGLRSGAIEQTKMRGTFGVIGRAGRQGGVAYASGARSEMREGFEASLWVSIGARTREVLFHPLI